MAYQKKRNRNKRVRTRAKWLLVVSALLVVAGGVMYARVELGNSTVNITAPFRPQYSVNTNPQSSIDLVAELSGIQDFRECYGTTGAGQKIALIDSGIDLSHPVFLDASNETRKVMAYYDYTSEGKLYTEAVQREQQAVSFGGVLYQIGGIYHNAETYYMAFLELDTVQPTTQPANSQKIAVLVTAVGEQYDCVYLDTNQNCDFTDEQPLYCYQNGGSYVTIPLLGYPASLAVTEIAPDGRSIHISADTLGHGTFLASVIAADCASYQGLAPQATLYVYKIFDKKGASSQLLLAKAIEQAVQDGVDCINLSLSIQNDEVILPQLSSALRLAEKHDIPVIAAAGNYGPGSNTIAYPACDPSVIAVGSYVHPEQYLLDRAVMVEDCFIAEYSGRGTLDGTVAPWLVAPSGVIAAVPSWYSERFMYDYGTSISAAIATAAMSHLQEAYALTKEQCKTVLAYWAQDLAYDAYVQGYGALYMGTLPIQASAISLPEQKRFQPILYQFPTKLFSDSKEKEDKRNLLWQFSIPQGKSQSWYLVMPDDVQRAEVVLMVNTQAPSSPLEHLIAMGRCKLDLYDPDGKRVDSTDYIGAAYGRTLVTSDLLSVWHPKSGVWELVVTSADNLSVYNHWETLGTVYVSISN